MGSCVKVYWLRYRVKPPPIGQVVTVKIPIGYVVFFYSKLIISIVGNVRA